MGVGGIKSNRLDRSTSEQIEQWNEMAALRFQEGRGGGGGGPAGGQISKLVFYAQSTSVVISERSGSGGGGGQTSPGSL